MLFAAGLVLSRRFGSAEWLLAHYDSLRASVAAHPVATIAGYVAVYTAAVAVSLPGAAALTIVGGLLFGWLAGGFAAMVGSIAGGTILFLVARTTLGNWLAGRGGPRLRGLMAGFREDAVNYLLFLRLVPVFPFWLVNIAAGIVGIRLRQFLAATAIGIVPGTFVYASAGAALDGVVAVQKGAFEACRAARRLDCGLDLAPRNILTPGMLVALAGLGLLAILPVLLRRWRRSRSAAMPAALPPETLP
ncbi:TVP38/TMEM64 family protein [Alsobacter sp. R-9]